MAANGALEKVSRGVAAAGHCVPGSKMIVLAVVVLWGRLRLKSIDRYCIATRRSRRSRTGPGHGGREEIIFHKQCTRVSMYEITCITRMPLTGTLYVCTHVLPVYGNIR